MKKKLQVILFLFVVISVVWRWWWFTLNDPFVVEVMIVDIVLMSLLRWRDLCIITCWNVIVIIDLLIILRPVSVN